MRISKLIAAGALVAGTLLVPAIAHAAPTAAIPSAEAGIRAGLGAEATALLAGSLGDRSAGSYLDTASGRMIVTVTDAEAAAAVYAAGALPHMVTRSGADLRAATSELDRSAKIPGTTWAVDPATNQILVTADSTVTGEKLATMKRAVAGLNGAARLVQEPGVLNSYISGGNAIYMGSSRCSLGFNVNRGGVNHFITAGHCTNLGTTFWSNSSHTTVIGSRIGTSFPTNDYGIVRYSGSITRPGNVYLWNGAYQDITSAGNAFVGQAIKRSGSTTGLRSGSVTALNATVNYPQGTVYQMIRTNACAEGGDSGGSMFAGSVALGLTSGGSGNCSSGGTTYFQPVPEVLSVYAASIY